MGRARRIAEDIRPFRKRLGWSQSDLADHLHVDELTVWRWENGRSTPQKRFRP